MQCRHCTRCLFSLVSSDDQVPDDVESLVWDAYARLACPAPCLKSCKQCDTCTAYWGARELPAASETGDKPRRRNRDTSPLSLLNLSRATIMLGECPYLPRYHCCPCYVIAPLAQNATADPSCHATATLIFVSRYATRTFVSCHHCHFDLRVALLLPSRKHDCHSDFGTCHCHH